MVIAIPDHIVASYVKCNSQMPKANDFHILLLKAVFEDEILHIVS